jgi:hypothetical protein
MIFDYHKNLCYKKKALVRVCGDSILRLLKIISSQHISALAGGLYASKIRSTNYAPFLFNEGKKIGIVNFI